SSSLPAPRAARRRASVGGAPGDGKAVDCSAGRPGVVRPHARAPLSRRRLRPCRDLGLRPRQHALPARRAPLRPDRDAHDGLRDAVAGCPARGGRPAPRRLLAALRHDPRRADARTRAGPGALPRRRARHRARSPRARPRPRRGHRRASRPARRLHQWLGPLCRPRARRARACRRLRRGLRGGARGLPAQTRASGLRDGLRLRRDRRRPQRDVRGRSAQPRRTARDGDAYRPCRTHPRTGAAHPSSHRRPRRLPRPAPLTRGAPRAAATGRRPAAIRPVAAPRGRTHLRTSEQERPMTARPDTRRLPWYYSIPLFGWIARDLVHGTPDNLLYFLVIFVTLLVLAVKAWGLVALTMVAL